MISKKIYFLKCTARPFPILLSSNLMSYYTANFASKNIMTGCRCLSISTSTYIIIFLASCGSQPTTPDVICTCLKNMLMSFWHGILLRMGPDSSVPHVHICISWLPFCCSPDIISRRQSLQ